MKYKTKKVLEIIEEIDRALEFIASPVENEAMIYERTLVATPLRLTQHVLTNTRNFLAKEGGE
jgi:hypothetical protein